jgi:hypothetical protein
VPNTDWIDDGHTIEVILNANEFRVHPVCPFDDTGFVSVLFESLPACRQYYTEDGAPFDLDVTGVDRCHLVALAEEFDADELFDQEQGEKFPVISPMPVEYRSPADCRAQGTLGRRR